MSVFNRVITSGAVVNFFLGALGCLLCLAFKKGIPEKIKTTLMNGMALCVIYIGITGLFEEGINVIIIIISFALGAVLGELADFDALDYIEVYGEITSFQGALQVNVKRIRKCGEGEYNPADYLPVSKYDIEEMYRELLGYISWKYKKQK